MKNRKGKVNLSYVNYLAAERGRRKAELDAARDRLETLDRTIVRMALRYGERPRNARTMRELIGEVSKLQVIFGADLVVNQRMARVLFGKLPRSAQRKLFRRDVVYSLVPGAEEFAAANLPARFLPHWRRAVARKKRKPSVRVAALPADQRKAA
ncbi:MAG TPA: hypothetical protein VNL38_01495 [Candidatus Nitrosotenuis sp.]|nr:hypothetical protein [Candidatus Nitrosotenuis sp.]